MTVFLFTDIQGSTELLEQYGDAMTRAMLQHEALLRQIVEQHGGQFIKNTGDGIFAAFEAGSPLACALEMQQRLAEQDWGELGELKVRVVLHAGAAEYRGDDYYGLEVSRTSRLLTAAWGGQIIFTPVVLEACALPTSATLQDHGMHILKDLSEPQHIYELLHPDLPAREFPPLRSLSSRPHNLPFQPTAFIGREEEIEQISAQLADPRCRLLTLMGPGGTGKTRLALQAAALHLEDFLHGAHFVALAPLASSELLVPAIAEALKFSFHTHEVPKTQLLNYLRQKTLLLVMDNFEHILDGASLISEILLMAPQVKVLATSRERLNIRGETVLEIAGMGYPENVTVEDFETYSAVLLFLETAQRANTSFTPAEQLRPALLSICRMVEGLPLAIEIAASWTRLLSLPEIAQEIQHSLDFLETPLRDLPVRHRSLRAVFEYSWILLTEQEKQAFRRLSVFHGKFNRQAALQVSQVALPHLASLADKSLVKFFSPDLYDLHTLLRQYAAERLAENPAEQQQTHAQHCAYYTDLLHRNNQSIHDSRQTQTIQEISHHIQDILAAWNWASENNQAEAIGRSLDTLFAFYGIRGWMEEGIACFTKALHMLERLEATQPSPAQAVILARLQIHLGRFLTGHDDYNQAEEIIQQGLQTLRQLGQPADVALGLSLQGRIHWIRGEHTQASGLYQEGLAIAQQINNPLLIASLLNDLGSNAWATGQFVEARQFFEQGLAIYRHIGNPTQITTCLDNLGVVARDMGDLQTAKKYAQECITLLKEIGAQFHLAYALNHLACCYTLMGDPQAALLIFDESLATGKDVGDRRIVAYTLADTAETLHNLGHPDQARQRYEQARQYFLEIGDAFGEIYATFSLGYLLTTLKEYREAAGWLAQALQKAQQTDNQRVLLESLAYAAHWFDSQDQPERCLEIIGYILPRAGDLPSVQEQIEPILARLRQSIPPEVVQAALARGQESPIERAIASLREAS